jgi:uncharacterized protein YndB with AHSA1/START domain
MKLIDVNVSRTIAAPPEKVFDVWLDPKSPGGPWYGAGKVILNPVVDGLYYHAVEHEGRTWAHYGRFVELDRPRRAVFTWMSEATKGLESVVSLTLEPHDGKTQLTLRHTGIPDDELGHSHEGGWNWIVSALADGLAGKRK